MAKKRTSRKRRAYSYVKKRFSKTRLPLETVIAAISIPFVPAGTGWGNIYDTAKTGDFGAVGRTMAKGFLALEPDGTMDIIGAINPFDQEKARYSKILLYSYLIGLVRKKIAPGLGKGYQKIPLIGKYVS
jgi:hypothetical protein